MEDSELNLNKSINNQLDICAGKALKNGKLKISDGSRGVVYRSDEEEGEKHVVCMPSPCALGCSFDRELVREVGRAVGSIADEGSISALLSPDAGVVRSPLYGSMADRFGEDPYLCGMLTSEWIKGVQSEGVAAVLNSFAGSHQATGKFTCDSMIDKRALHEIYLRPYETAVKLSHPKAVFCGINKINGLAVCENHVLLTDILRRQWHFDGAVLADMRITDPSEAMACGVDMSYPYGGFRVKRRLKKALRDEIIPRHYPGASAGRIRSVAESDAG